METFISFLIAAAVTFFFVRRYVKGLSEPKKAAKTGAADRVIEIKTEDCPRCAKPMQSGSTFCPHCGAALSLWTVQRAAVQQASVQAPAGKPRPVINASMCIGCGSCVHECPETGTLELVNGKAILAHPQRCLGHAKCAEVCPTQAIALSFGGVLQTIRVPLVRDNFETNVPGVFIIGELGGVGLIKTGINEGKLVMDHLKRRVADAGERPDANGSGDILDVIIVGTGPAGLSAALTGHQHELKYLALEQGEIASTIRQYPRHKLVMAEPLEMPLYGSLYIGDGSKETLLSIWETIIANTGVRIRTNTRVTVVRRQPSHIDVETEKGVFRAQYVVLATGKRGSPLRLGVPGEELAKVAYRLIEADSYAECDLLVVGGGDSAVEAALALAKRGRNRVTLSYRGDSFHRIKDRNKVQLSDAEGSGELCVMRNSKVLEIRKDSAILEQNSRIIEIPNNFVVILIGGESPEGFLRKLGIEVVEKALSV